MKDNKLEEQISSAERFIERWKRLGKIVFPGKDQEKVSDEELLRLKEELASLHGSLMVSLGIDERRGIDFLDGLGKSSQGGELRRLQDSWHGCLIFADEALGRLKERRKELAAISGFTVARRAVFSNAFVRLAALVLCILLLHHLLKTYVIREESPPEGAGAGIGEKL